MSFLTGTNISASSKKYAVGFSNVISIEVLLEKLIEKGVLSQEEVTAIKLETGKRYNEAVEKMIAEQKTEKK